MQQETENLLPHEIELVQQAWARISGGSQSYVQEVYDELFRLDPALQPLFTDDRDHLMTKMADTLNTLLTSLEALDRLAFIIRDIGRRHRQHGARPPHFTTLKQAMTTVLAHRLGERFTPELAAAWSHAYDLVARLMLQGMQAK